MTIHIERLTEIPIDLTEVALVTDGAWIGVRGDADARELVFGGRVVRTSIACAHPMICALDAQTAVLVDARVARQRPNAWVVRDDGERLAEFNVGDAVQQVIAVGGRLLVTHFDESWGAPRHGALVFSATGTLLFDYRWDVSDPVDLVDCYAAVASANLFLLLAYPDFPLVEVDLRSRSQRVWPTPDVVHGAAAISPDGDTVFFHQPYRDGSGVYVWERGASEAHRVAGFEPPLVGLPGGWFFGRVGDSFARVRFSTARPAGRAPGQHDT